MNTLIVYDNTGKVFYQITGDYLTPRGGIQYLEKEIPEGKQIVEVDVSVTPHEVILEDRPKSEVQLLQEKIDAQELAIFELAEILGGL